MKNIARFIMALVFACAVVPCMADEDPVQQARSNEELSAVYKQQIVIIKNEIKTIKAKQKLEPANGEYSAQLVAKKAEMEETKNKKKIVDQAIKTEKAAKKAAEKAEKARVKAEKAAANAAKLRD